MALFKLGWYNFPNPFLSSYPSRAPLTSHILRESTRIDWVGTLSPSSSVWHAQEVGGSKPPVWAPPRLTYADKSTCKLSWDGSLNTALKSPTILYVHSRRPSCMTRTVVGVFLLKLQNKIFLKKSDFCVYLYYTNGKDYPMRSRPHGVFSLSW